MKICPTCQNRYTDDTLQFCLQDGAALIGDDSDASSSPTIAFNEEAETVVKNRANERMQVDLQNQSYAQNRTQPQNYSQQIPTGTANYQTVEKKSNTGLIILATALATLLLGAIGVGAWFLFGNKKDVAQNTNVKNSVSENSNKNKNENSADNSNAKQQQQPTPKPTATAAPKPDFDPEKIRAEVSGTVDSWATLAESRDLSAYMDNYADKVDYYNKKSVDKSAVRADKQRAFGLYDTIEFNVSNLRVMPDATGENATAVFDKQWYFENEEKSNEGKVQTQLQMKKIGGDWKITSERDLKVYYTK